MIWTFIAAIIAMYTLKELLKGVWTSDSSDDISSDENEVEIAPNANVAKEKSPIEQEITQKEMKMKCTGIGRGRGRRTNLEDGNGPRPKLFAGVSLGGGPAPCTTLPSTTPPSTSRSHIQESSGIGAVAMDRQDTDLNRGGSLFPQRIEILGQLLDFETELVHDLMSAV